MPHGTTHFPYTTLFRSLVAGAKPLALAVSVYPVPVLLRLKSKKVATPLTAATGVVPLRIAPPGFVPSATVTLPVRSEEHTSELQSLTNIVCHLQNMRKK